MVDVAEDMGFAGFDSAVMCYYTATFTKGSFAEFAQSTSRTHRLPQVMAKLQGMMSEHASMVGDSQVDLSDISLLPLEQMCTRELAKLSQGAGGEVGRDGDGKKRAFVADLISQILQDETTELVWRHDSTYLKDEVSPVFYFQVTNFHSRIRID